MRIVVSVGLLLSLMVSSVLAQTVSPAPIVNDEGGAVLITGTLTYTNLRFTSGVSQPVIILEDQAGFVDRDQFYLMSVESQVLGQLTSDFYPSPVDYSLTLPQVPRGGYRDVDHGAEIIALDGVLVGETVEDVVPWNSPFSAEHIRRLEQFRYLMCSPVGTDVEVTFRNPGDTEDRTVTLVSVDEWESFEFSSVREAFTGYELPLEYHRLPSGYAYVKIYSFSDDRMLSIQLWERLMEALRLQRAPGLIIDMRENLGGNGYLAYQMAAYLFDESLAALIDGPFDAFSDGEASDPRLAERFLAPEEKRYMGEVAVLVGPNCNSACEFFTYYLIAGDRATVVGQYPTAGLGGGVTYFLAPLGIYFQFTASQGLDADGNIHIEGQGVVPDVRVPVNEETLFSPGDPVLEAAIQYLDGR